MIRVPEGLGEAAQLSLFPVLWDFFQSRCQRHAQLCSTHPDLALSFERAYYPAQFGLCSICLKSGCHGAHYNEDGEINYKEE